MNAENILETLRKQALSSVKQSDGSSSAADSLPNQAELEEGEVQSEEEPPGYPAVPLKSSFAPASSVGPDPFMQGIDLSQLLRTNQPPPNFLPPVPRLYPPYPAHNTFIPSPPAFSPAPTLSTLHQAASEFLTPQQYAEFMEAISGVPRVYAPPSQTLPSGPSHKQIIILDDDSDDVIMEDAYPAAHANPAKPPTAPAQHKTPPTEANDFKEPPTETPNLVEEAEFLLRALQPEAGAATPAPIASVAPMQLGPATSSDMIIQFDDDDLSGPVEAPDNGSANLASRPKESTTPKQLRDLRNQIAKKERELARRKQEADKAPGERAQALLDELAAEMAESVRPVRSTAKRKARDPATNQSTEPNKKAKKVTDPPPTDQSKAREQEIRDLISSLEKDNERIRGLHSQVSDLTTERSDTESRLKALQSQVSKMKLALVAVQTKETEAAQSLTLAQRQADEKQRLLTSLAARLPASPADALTPSNTAQETSWPRPDWTGGIELESDPELSAQLLEQLAELGNYTSPLFAFNSYRLAPWYPLPLAAALHSNSVTDPMKVVCRFDLSGVCNDDECPDFHTKHSGLNDAQLAKDLAQYLTSSANSLASDAEVAVLTTQAILRKGPAQAPRWLVQQAQNRQPLNSSDPRFLSFTRTRQSSKKLLDSTSRDERLLPQVAPPKYRKTACQLPFQRSQESQHPFKRPTPSEDHSVDSDAELFVSLPALPDTLSGEESEDSDEEPSTEDDLDLR